MGVIITRTSQPARPGHLPLGWTWSFRLGESWLGGTGPLLSHVDPAAGPNSAAEAVESWVEERASFQPRRPVHRGSEAGFPE